MSDSIRNDDLTVDPRLDSLLARALGRGTVSREQRQRHLERLGLTPRLGGSAGLWRVPVVAGRPPSSMTPQPAAPPAHRRRRQWLELGAAVLAVVLVASLLVALFRDWGGGEDDQQLAASPEATATPRETREQLYVVSHAMSRGQDAILTEGRVSAIDPDTGEEYWSIEAGPRIDSVLSPDGRRLFVADSGRDGDHLYALDTLTGRELWREPIEDRQWHKPGGGYSTLSVSADGSTVSVYACEGCTGEFRSTDGRNWLARFDAATGNRQPDLEIAACRGQTFLAPAGPSSRPLYVVCDRTRRLEIVDLATGQALELTYDTFLEGGFPETIGVNAAAVAPDGRWLYLASGNRLTVIDMTINVATRVQLDEGINVSERLPLLTLSPDGRRLFTGSIDTAAYERGRAEINRVDVYDTKSLQPLGQMELSYPLTGTAFAALPDGDSVTGTFSFRQPSGDVIVESPILRLTYGSEPATVATRTNEEVLFLFAGTVDVDLDATPQPQPTPEPTAQERLFAVSSFTQSGQGATGRVTAYDAASGELVYRIDTLINPDAVLSPDGTRLYIVSGGVVSSGGTSDTTLQAVEAASGNEIWSVAIEHRIPWVRGEGPTTLAVSYDGSRLFAYGGGESGGSVVQVFDTEDGGLIGTIEEVTGCTAQLFPSADGRSLYVVCHAERFPPQVIDLETMTSAGVIQGFGGIISGAAASPDGRYLYIPQDFDTEMSLSVIDMNGRVVSDMRSIIHLARDPLHSLNITAVSPDGSRLFIGVGSEPEDGAPVASQVWAWDTSMLHVGASQMIAPEEITGWSLAPGPDNRSVFAVHNEDGLDAGGQPSKEAVIMRLNIDDGSNEFVRYWGGDILRVFTGRVTDALQPLSTDEPDSGACPAVPLVGPEIRGRFASMEGNPAEYWIDGESLSLGQVEGRLVEGATEVTFITAPTNGLADPDPNARVTMRGTRQFTDYVPSVPLQLLDQTVDWNVPAGDEVRVHIRSTVIFPTSGCWQIEAEFGMYTLQAVVNVEPAATAADLGEVWDVLRWRPLHELASESSPPCRRTAGQQVIADFGPLVGDVEANGGPVFLNGPGEEGVIPIAETPLEDGGYYARVMFVTDGSYSGPMLVRAATGSGSVQFSLAPPEMTPGTEWHLDDPGGTTPTAGVRHWIVYLRFDDPGCHALQIDGLDFTSIIAFEVVADEALNEPAVPTWDGSLYALSHEEGTRGVVELDGMTGEVRRRIDMIPYGNSYPHLEVRPEADRLAVAGSLPGEEVRLDVLIYRLSDFTLLQRVPVPTLIQSFGVGDGIALSPDGRFLYAYQYEAPPDGNGNNARYWLGTYDLDERTWLADVELPGCGTVARMEVRTSPYVYVQCSRTGLLNVDTATGAIERIDGRQQTASFQHHSNKTLLLTTSGAFYSGAYWPADDPRSPDHFDIPSGWTVAAMPFRVSGAFTFAYLPIQPRDSNDPTGIAVVDLNTNAVTRTIRTSVPFREIAFASDAQFAYVTLVDANDFTTGISRIDLATGGETLLIEGYFGNLVAVPREEQ